MNHEPAREITMSELNGHSNGKGKGGTKYTPQMNEQVRKLCLLGARDLDISGFFGIGMRTLNDWKKRHPEFFAALKDGKAEADAKVERSLFERATGYSGPAEKVTNSGVIVKYTEHYAPDTGACIFWLKNRKPDQWKERVEQQHSGEVEVKVNYVTKEASRFADDYA